VEHIFSGRKGEFGLLKVKARLREAVEIADVIVMEMRADDILDLLGRTPKKSSASTGLRR
jgi:hypothetical protein